MDRVLVGFSCFKGGTQVVSLTGRWGIKRAMRDSILVETLEHGWVNELDILDDVILENIPTREVFYLSNEEMLKTTGRETKNYIEVEFNATKYVSVPRFKFLPFIFSKEERIEYTKAQWRNKNEFLTEINECEETINA